MNYYVKGRSFDLVTDHKALVALNEKGRMQGLLGGPIR
jgi:hypothetical protein